MVIVRLTGGLGNQMFQYAAARRIAWINKSQLKLDLSWFHETGDWTSRSFELGIFGLDCPEATLDEVKTFRSRRQNPIFRRLPSFLKSIVLHRNQPHIIEKSFNFDPEIMRINGDAYLDGFWQSIKYFEDIEETIRTDFTFVGEPGNLNRQVVQELTSCEAVSVHIRRGDYVSLPSANSFHGVCSLKYYQTAAKQMKNIIKKPHFFIFSDDIPWVRRNLNLEAPTYYVDHNDAMTAGWDMWLMSKCRYHVIANSSFSWWGAWLANYPDKRVIAPENWFANSPIDTNDLIPNDWMRL